MMKSEPCEPGATLDCALPEGKLPAAADLLAKHAAAGVLLARIPVFAAESQPEVSATRHRLASATRLPPPPPRLRNAVLLI